MPPPPLMLRSVNPTNYHGTVDYYRKTDKAQELLTAYTNIMQQCVKWVAYFGETRELPIAKNPVKIAGKSVTSIEQVEEYLDDIRIQLFNLSQEIKKNPSTHAVLKGQRSLSDLADDMIAKINDTSNIRTVNTLKAIYAYTKIKPYIIAGRAETSLLEDRFADLVAAFDKADNEKDKVTAVRNIESFKDFLENSVDTIKRAAISVIAEQELREVITPLIFLIRARCDDFLSKAGKPYAQSANPDTTSKDVVPVKTATVKPNLLN